MVSEGRRDLEFGFGFNKMDRSIKYPSRDAEFLGYTRLNLRLGSCEHIYHIQCHKNE